MLDAALGVFRSKGFERTSIRDLETATGLHNGSLYKAYDSKAGLFDAVLAAYNERVVQGRIEKHLAAGADPIGGLTAFFASTYEDRPTPDPGCLLTNSAIDAPALSNAARGAVAGGLETIEDAFMAAVCRAQSLGQVSTELDPGVLAARLLALYQGVLVLVRFGHPRKELSEITEAIPAILGQTQEGRS